MEAYLAGLFTGTVVGFARMGRWAGSLAGVVICGTVAWLLVDRGVEAFGPAITEVIPAVVLPHLGLIAGLLVGAAFGVALDRRLPTPPR